MFYTSEFLASIYGNYWGEKRILMDWKGKPRLFKASYGIDQCLRYILPDGMSFSEICKLVLKKLEDITEEEIHMAYEAAGVEEFIDDFTKKDFIEVFNTTDSAEVERRFGQPVYYIIMDFLRQRGYDMGYSGFNGEEFITIQSLIEAGIAIDIKTIENEK